MKMFITQSKEDKARFWVDKKSSGILQRRMGENFKKEIFIPLCLKFSISDLYFSNRSFIC